MKKIFILCTCLMSAFQTFAQINLKDSTALVIAYWCKGEKYNYNYASQTLDIKGSDTTLISYSESKFELEVIDSTSNGYLINYTKLSEAISIPDENSPLAGLMKKLANAGNSISITLKTDESGKFQEIVNFDEYKKQLISQLEILAREVENDLKKAGMKKSEIEAVLLNVLTPFMSDTFIYKTIEHVTSMLSFHGKKMKLAEKYTNAIQIASPFESGKNLDGELTRYVAEYNPETSWTTFHSITSYNKEQLKMAVFNYLNSIAPKGQKIAISEIPQISMDGYTSITVHLDTGWPGYAALLQETAHPDKTRLKRWYIEIEL